MKKSVSVALSYVGYKEGANNYTIFAEDFDKNHPTFYNTKKQNAPWCDIFVDHSFVEAYGEDKAREMLCQPLKSCGAGCAYSASYFQAKGRFGSTPHEGDQIFFYDSNRKINHTGLVTKADRDFVWTVEGNKNNMVCECKYSLRDTSIAGYGYPLYELVEDNETPTPTPTKNVFTVELTEISLGSKGKSVKTLQIILNGYGFKGENGKVLSVDGDAGRNTIFALKAYQRSVGLKDDGICGAKTIKSFF